MHLSICGATINEALDFVFFTCSQVVKNFSIGRGVTMYTVATLVIAIGRVWEPGVTLLGSMHAVCNEIG